MLQYGEWEKQYLKNTFPKEWGEAEILVCELAQVRQGPKEPVKPPLTENKYVELYRSGLTYSTESVILLDDLLAKVPRQIPLTAVRLRVNPDEISVEEIRQEDVENYDELMLKYQKQLMQYKVKLQAHQNWLDLQKSKQNRLTELKGLFRDALKQRLCPDATV